jgi:hypothetical protein
MLQRGFRKDVSLQFRRFISGSLFRGLTGSREITRPLARQPFEHIINHRLSSTQPLNALNASQLSAIKKINFLSLLIAIQVPGGTGKTSMIAAAINQQDYNKASKSKTHDITILATMKNSTTLNMALAFEKMGKTFPRFILVVSTTVLHHASSSDMQHHERLKERGLLWQPSDLRKLDAHNNQKGQRVINGTWVLISTVRLDFIYLDLTFVSLACWVTMMFVLRCSGTTSSVPCVPPNSSPMKLRSQA